MALQLTDFKPLERVALPGLGPLTSTGLILLVGPNSSGKSQLLQDLFHRICGEPRDLLVSDGYLERYRDPNGREQLRPLTTYVGTGQPPSQIELGQPSTWWNSYDTQGASGVIDYRGSVGLARV